MGFKIIVKLNTDSITFESSGLSDDMFDSNIYGYNPLDMKCCKIEPYWDKIENKISLGYIPFVLSGGYPHLTNNGEYYIISPGVSKSNFLLPRKTKEQTFEIYKELCKFLSNNILKFKA